jgi:threonine synthase
MDIQVPSNFERYLFELWGRDGEGVAEAMRLLGSDGILVLDEGAHESLRQRFVGHWYDQDQIEAAIAAFHDIYGELIDPHSAIGWMAGQEEISDRPMVSVATAHPSKFSDAVLRATGVEPSLPTDLADLASRRERIRTIPADLESVANLLSELPRA